MNENEACLNVASAELVRTMSYVNRLRKVRKEVGWAAIATTLLLTGALVAVGLPWLINDHALTAMQGALVFTTTVLVLLVKAWSDLGQVLSEIAIDRNELVTEVSSLRLFTDTNNLETPNA